MSNKEPTFEEGPFFLIDATVPPYTERRAVVWATDETTALNVFAAKLNFPTTCRITQCIGDLSALKDSLKLSPAQLSDLHREGYLRL